MPGHPGDTIITDFPGLLHNCIVPCLAHTQGKDLVRHVPGKRRIQILETTDNRALHQFFINLALVTALVAAHQRHALFPGDLGQPLTVGRRVNAQTRTGSSAPAVHRHARAGVIQS